jgi:hypothetical protein
MQFFKFLASIYDHLIYNKCVLSSVLLNLNLEGQSSSTTKVDHHILFEQYFILVVPLLQQIKYTVHLLQEAKMYTGPASRHAALWANAA